MDAPLILTLRFDDACQAFFDRLRQAHFPPERNFLRAHVTLFHALPGDAFAGVTAALQERACATPAPAVMVEAPYPLGGGVAFRLSCPDVLALRRTLAERWAGALTRQDESFSRLHVTVQNKVAPAEARRLLAALSGAPRPERFISPGLALWRYCGGPWEALQRFDFAA